MSSSLASSAISCFLILFSNKVLDSTTLFASFAVFTPVKYGFVSDLRDFFSTVVEVFACPPNTAADVILFISPSFCSFFSFSFTTSSFSLNSALSSKLLSLSVAYLTEVAF